MIPEYIRGEVVFTCPYCGESQTSNYIYIHEKSNKKMFECRTCHNCMILELVIPCIEVKIHTIAERG